MSDIYTKKYFLDLLQLVEKNEVKARAMGRVDLADVLVEYKIDLKERAEAAA